MTKKNGGRGDLKVKFDVEYPKQLGDDVKELLVQVLPDLDE
jgi:DnaJ-class molecular chaperone